MSFFKLSKGWLGVNIVVTIIISVGLASWPLIQGEGQIGLTRVILSVTIYWILFFVINFLIKWLKEGFNEK